jgi:hypothetical protein
MKKKIENKENTVEKSVRPQNKFLKPFTKNDLRINRKGAPKGKRLSTLIKEELEKVKAITKDGIELTKGQLIINAHTEKAMKGDFYSTQLLWDRLEGKPKTGLLNDNDDENDVRSVTIKIVKKK